MAYGAYQQAQGEYFTVAPPGVEGFQPLAKDASHEAIETSYFGFNIPEHAINCVIYHWFHTRLAVASGGIYIYQGLKSHQLEAECFDWRHFMPIPADLTDQQYPTGLRIRMMKPSGEFRIEYSDPIRNHHLNLLLEPVMPLAVRSTGNHFTQAMRTQGQLRLNGVDYQIAGHYTRDRSWSENRTERPIDLPPLTWITGVFGDDFAFHVMAHDSIIHWPQWSLAYPKLDLQKNHLWGYLYRDGRLLGIRNTEKRTEWESDGLTPAAYSLRLEDEEGGITLIDGRAIAREPIQPWANMQCFVGLIRWTCAERIGFGDAQEMVFGDHLRSIARTI
jgi:hypothetical protein